MLFFLRLRLLAASAHASYEVLEKSDYDYDCQNCEQEQDDDKETECATNSAGERRLRGVQGTGHNRRGRCQDAVEHREHNDDQDRDDHESHHCGDDDLHECTGEPVFGLLHSCKDTHVQITYSM